MMSKRTLLVFGAILIALSLVQIWLGRRSSGEGE